MLKNVTDTVFYVGVDDKDIDLFENQYIVPNGIAYNSYVIMDEKIAIMDMVDAKCADQWFANVAEVLGDRKPDYLIISHLEPDHSANLGDVLAKYPDIKIVSNAKLFGMLPNFFEVPVADRSVTVAEGQTLSLGSHMLQFFMAPMVHWPEVMVTYEQSEKILFSADAFGKFGTLDTDEDWACEARRYYFNIVGKYGMPAQALLKKAAGLDIQIICPLHGPVLTENLGYYIGLYDTWSSYGVETDGVVIAYTSVYGHTKEAAELLAKKLTEKGCPKVAVNDLARCDMAEAVEDAFRYGKLVLATTTYNGDIFPFMREFINHLTERNFQNRTIGLIENGAWAPMAAKVMKGMFENSKNLTFTDTTVQIKAALNDASLAQIDALADELCK